MLGELNPVGGGDPIPLLKPNLMIGRRESCDIVLRFANVSSNHCELALEDGYWFVRDLNSSNGVKVNGDRVTEKRLDPGDTLSVAKHAYTIQYVPSETGASGPPPAENTAAADIMSKSLLERIGMGGRQRREKSGRYDVLSDQPGQIRKPSDPV